jgi:protease I
MASELENVRIAAIMTDGFEQIEFTSPRDALQGKGAVVDILSPKEDHVQGYDHHDKADQFDVDIPIEQADPADYDAVLLPGGVINGDALRLNKEAQLFVQQINDDNKPIFVICHGGWLLISANLVRGRKITSWPTLQDDMRNAGARWMDESVVVDENLISSRKPDDLPDFNRELLGALGVEQVGAELS